MAGVVRRARNEKGPCLLAILADLIGRASGFEPASAKLRRAKPPTPRSRTELNGRGFRRIPDFLELG